MEIWGERPRDRDTHTAGESRGLPVDDANRLDIPGDALAIVRRTGRRRRCALRRAVDLLPERSDGETPPASYRRPAPAPVEGQQTGRSDIRHPRCLSHLLAASLAVFPLFESIVPTCFAVALSRIDRAPRRAKAGRAGPPPDGLPPCSGSCGPSDRGSPFVLDGSRLSRCCGYLGPTSAVGLPRSVFLYLSQQARALFRT